MADAEAATVADEVEAAEDAAELAELEAQLYGGDEGGSEDLGSGAGGQVQMRSIRGMAHGQGDSQPTGNGLGLGHPRLCTVSSLVVSRGPRGRRSHSNLQEGGDVAAAGPPMTKSQMKKKARLER